MQSYAYVVKADPQFDLQQAQKQVSSTLNAELTLIKELSLREHRGALFACELTEPKAAQALLKAALLPFDAWILPKLPALAHPGLLVLDMDMTSVQIEGIDEIARRVGVFEQVASLTHQAMQGGLDFATSLRNRVALLKGGSAEVISAVKTVMHETRGLDLLLSKTLEAGWQRGICSGGFVQLIEVLAQKYQLQFVHANSLGFDEQGKLSGQVVGDVVDAEGKASAVRMYKQQLKLEPSQVIVLGDGANDLKMIAEAGIGIAYHAKPIVVKQAPYAISHSDLTAVTLLLQLGTELA